MGGRVMTDDKLIRPLHRQRGRHRTVRVLGEEELVELLGVPAEQLPARLQALGWRFHQDGGGRVWATEQAQPPSPNSP